MNAFRYSQKKQSNEGILLSLPFHKLENVSEVRTSLTVHSQAFQQVFIIVDTHEIEGPSVSSDKFE